MAKLILFVDDDKLPMQYYVQALEKRGFEVQRYFEPDNALEFIMKENTQIEVIIMDIMMPFGKYGADATKKGLITGVLLLDDIRKYCPNTPVIILTNVKNPKTHIKFEEGDLLKIIQKTDCPPFELVDLVNEVIPNTNKPTNFEK